MYVLGEAPHAQPKPAPPPRPVPKSGGFLGGFGAAVNQAVAKATRPPYPTTASLPRTDAQTSPHGDYGTAQANAFKRTPAYRQAVTQVFAAQPPRQQKAIVQGALRNPTPEGQIVINYLKGLGNRAPTAGPNVLSGVGAGLKDVYGLIAKPENFQGVASGQRTLGGEQMLAGLGKTAAGLLSHIPTGVGMPKEQRGIMEASGLGPGGLAKNAAKDLVNLPAEALPSVAIPIEQAAQGQWQQALHSITDPYVQAIKHPLQAVTQHPLNTYLMAGGPLHLGARALDTAQSLARTGHLPDVQAEPVVLTANLTHGRPDFSKSPITRFSQKTIEGQLYQRNPKGHLEPRNEAVRARLIKLETSRMVGQNERVRTAHRSQQLAAHAATVLKGRPARAAHSLATALRHNPEPALIPGANVLARIADTTVRRPDTVEQDLRTHLAQVAANRPNLIGFPKLLANHDQYVKELGSALNDKQFLRNPGPAFKAAEAYRKDYAPIQAAAHDLGHFRDMTKPALDRRELAHYAITHMGARQDPELGLVDTHGTPLSNRKIVDHLKGPEGTGGRMPAFTSDQPRSGDRAFYVNGQRRPRTAVMGNTYSAYTHGLTHPGHEALLEQRVRMQGIVDAHNAMNRLAQHLLLQNDRTGNVKAWATYSQAAKDAPEGYQPIRLSQPFHPPDSLKKALQTGNVNLQSLEEEAARRSLDINARLQPSSEPGQWAVIDKHAAQQLQAHENLISPDAFFRTFRGLTNQFRTVALATSFRHLPGVFQEQILRAAAEGIGPVSLLAGRAALRRAERINPKLGEERHIQLTGGTASGQALTLQTRQVARHYEGTLLHGPLTAFSNLMATPGFRQLGNSWRAWNRFVLHGTKRFLEENAQASAVGKQVIADFGGRHGLLSAAMGNWGKMIDQAAQGILDEHTAARMGAYVRRVYGRWTDLTPGEQRLLMFSPFGMWWTNSVAWLMRMPVDHPAGAAFMAALNTGTEQERQKLGLDMFSPNHLPLYQQGGIPVGGKLWGANYYSAFGVANDPGETATSLLLPWQSELAAALRGKNWKGETITSPGNPKGRNKPPFSDISTVIVNSLLGSFLPLYTKAQTIAQGGASSYDTSTALRPQTKKQNPGLLQGVKKAVMPIRLSSPAGASTGSATSPAGGGGWGGTTAPSSGGGWGGSTTSSGGWG